MTIRPLLTYPDPRLRLVAAPVTDFGPALRSLAADLLDTLRAAPGIGITAPHIGEPLRLVVLELPGEPACCYANPTILRAGPGTMRHPEGSIAMPGITEDIERPAAITLRYQDLDGAERAEESSGLLAICHQHEIDQLDGIFWLQRLSRLKRDKAIRRFAKLTRPGA